MAGSSGHLHPHFSHPSMHTHASLPSMQQFLIAWRVDHAATYYHKQHRFLILSQHSQRCTLKYISQHGLVTSMLKIAVTTQVLPCQWPVPVLINICNSGCFPRPYSVVAVKVDMIVSGWMEFLPWWGKNGNLPHRTILLLNAHSTPTLSCFLAIGGSTVVYIYSLWF